jgi:hypothetical protein
VTARRTHTHTVAILEVSPSAAAEIRRKLVAAQYQHTFMDDGVIDMSGIGIQADQAQLERLSWNGCITGDCPHDSEAECNKAIADDVRTLLKGFQPSLSPDAERPYRLLEPV